MRAGLDDEPWLTRVLQAVNEPRLRPGGPDVLDCSKGISLLRTDVPRGREERAVHDSGNPHYLLDPDNARPVTAAIRDALARVAPAHRARFDANRTGFLVLLDARLVRWSEALLPYKGSRVVLMHETWPYLARRFGLIVAGAVEPAPGVSPSPAYLTDLVKRMRDSGVKLVIGGVESNDAMMRLVARRAAPARDADLPWRRPEAGATSPRRLNVKRSPRPSPPAERRRGAASPGNGRRARGERRCPGSAPPWSASASHASRIRRSSRR